MNKYRFLPWVVLAVLSTVGGLNGQVSVQLHQPPPNQLKATDLWWVDLNNATRNTYTAYLHVEVTEARKGLVAKANSNNINIPLGQKRITQTDITEVKDTWYHGDYAGIFARTASFPSGDYTVCISVREAKTNNELAKDCIHQQIAGVGPFRLLAPQNGATVADKLPLFSWQPPTALPAGARYKLKLVEILPGQTKETAMRLNPSLLVQERINASQFRYPVQARSLESGKKYAWQVEVSYGTPAATAVSEIWEVATRIGFQPQLAKKPCLSVKRDVERHSNWFGITLSITNNCSHEISNIIVSDSSIGFQCIDDPTAKREYPPNLNQLEQSAFVPSEIHYDPVQHSSSIKIFLKDSPLEELKVLPPGRTITVRYSVIPFLYTPSAFYTPSSMYQTLQYKYQTPQYPENKWTIGRKLKIVYKAENEDRALTPSLPVTPDVNAAFNSANYLIVTTPQKLFDLNSSSSVDEVLVTIAKLAKAKKGVLGYLEAWAAQHWIVRALTLPGGGWSSKLASGWTQSGYLLLVGEKEIIPHGPDFNFVKSSGALQTIIVNDYFYSNISGGESPELKVGRILGTTATELRDLIEQSLDVFFHHNAENDGSDAFLASGKPKAAESATLFSNPTNSGATYLHDVKQINTTTYHYQANAANSDSVRQKLKNKDLVVICTHGGPSGLSGVISDGNLTSGDILSGLTRPVVVAFACHTGNYTAPEGSIAKDFLANGAAVYLGATVMTNTGDPGAQVGGNHQFLKYWNKGLRTGDVFRSWKIELATSPPGSCALRLMYAFNLYGDPKFGGD